MSPTIRTNLLSYASLICLSLCLGCAGSNLVSAKFGGDEADVPKSPQELPPKEAARACFVAAEEMQNSGHSEQAIALYEKARSKDPSIKSVSHRLATLYDAQGDSTRALAEYNKAVEVEPKNPNLLSDVGYYHYKRGNLTEAEQWLRKALALEPNHQKALSNLGLALAGQGRFDESFQAFSKVVGPAAAHSNVGVLLAKQGRNDQAKQAFHEALVSDPTLQQPKTFLAYLDKQQPIR